MPSNMTRADALAVLDRFGTSPTSVLATTRRRPARSLLASGMDLRAHPAAGQVGGSVVGRATLSVCVAIAGDQVLAPATGPILRDDFTTTTGLL